MENPEKKIKTEREISLEMEDKLRDIQAELDQADLDQPRRKDLQHQEKQVLLSIQRRAKTMLAERERSEKLEAGATRKKIAGRFNTQEDRETQLEGLKKDLRNFMQAGGKSFPAAEQDKIMAELDACRDISDRETLIDRIMAIMAPLIEFRKSNAKVFEAVQRKAFVSGEREHFIPIEETDEIISYGQDEGRVHLHLAPMRTLTMAEKIRFTKEVMPAAMKKLAQKLEDDPEIKLVTATSYIVAASQDLFRERIGFTKIGPMKKEWRLRYFADDEMPVLRAAMTREEFLQKWGK